MFNIVPVIAHDAILIFALWAISAIIEVISTGIITKPSHNLAVKLTLLMPVCLIEGNAIADIALSVIAILFVIHSHREKNWDWLKEGWVCALLLLWLYMIARGFFAERPKEALSRALPFVRYIIFAAALARWTLTHEATRRHFLNVLSLIVLFVACDGLLQYAIGYDVFLHKLIHDPNNGHIRLAGPFSRPILGIMLAWIAFPAILQLLFTEEGCVRQGKDLLRAITSALIVLTAIALSGERMALLLTIAGFALSILLLRPKLKTVLAGCAGFALLLGGIALLSPDMASRQIGSTGETLHHWQDSPYGMLLKSDLTLAGMQPVTGLGANHFRIACEALYKGDEAKITAMCNTHPHNIYFEWQIEEGIIGLALFGAFVLLVLKRSAGAFVSGLRHPAFAGLLIAFVLRVWPLMTTTGFFSRWGAPPFWLVLGALLVYTAKKGETNAGVALSVQDPRL